MKQEIGNSRAPLLCSCYHDNLRGLSGGFPIDNCPLRIVSNELPPVQLLPGQLLLNDSPWTMHPEKMFLMKSPRTITARQLLLNNSSWITFPQAIATHEIPPGLLPSGLLSPGQLPLNSLPLENYPTKKCCQRNSPQGNCPLYLWTPDISS